MGCCCYDQPMRRSPAATRTRLPKMNEASARNDELSCLPPRHLETQARRGGLCAPVPVTPLVLRYAIALQYTSTTRRWRRARRKENVYVCRTNFNSRHLSNLGENNQIGGRTKNLLRATLTGVHPSCDHTHIHDEELRVATSRREGEGRGRYRRG